MASLLVGSGSARTCSHREEAKASEHDGHSHHESVGYVQISETGNAIDDSCICAVDQRSPYVVSKSESKKLKSNDAISNTDQVIPDLEFVAVTRSGESSSVFTHDLSYPNTLKSLLPSRAPPRL